MIGGLCSLARTALTPDNPASDIAGANAHGWHSVLLRTGVYRDKDGPPAHAPTHIADHVGAGVLWALQTEMRRAAGRP